MAKVSRPQAPKKIDYHKIDKRWQKKWTDAKIFEANVDQKREKFFINIPYPYLNGAPHIGAGFTFIRGDVYARFKRMQGLNVLFPQGFHATGEPIVGAVKRLKQGDKSQKEAFKIYGVTDKDLKDFVKKGPKYVAKFWKKRWIEDLKAAGFSIDWRRTFITTTMTPTYSRFIEWQYNTLKKRGYVTQGTHPVVWCPKCKSPTGDHDRLEGVGESPIEYTIIKFKLTSGEILPCGTLRPETVYGVTNIWVDPDVEYVRVEVNGEKWIMSKAAIKKLEDQLKEIKIIDKIKGAELIGKACENPVTKTRIPVLPAEFCDPDAATGIVMSVPSHAPYDWIGLEDLKADKEQLEKYNLEKIVQAVEPISIIAVEGFGEHPAKEMCEKIGVDSQKDEDELEKATELLYKREFHMGVCKNNCGRYAGMKVAEIKEMLIEDFTDDKIADITWETTATVVCRCKTRCHIKILENQWFLKFSDPQWKERAHKCIDKMTFYPEEARQQFKNTVDWLRDKACTRRSGMGTPLPWDKEWIVETLSDSVIYMAYYTIAKTINEKKIKSEQLADEVFNYIFFGEGNITNLVKTSGLDKKTIEEMREEFEHFYPFDLRTSGKDLVQNHLTFSIFHHVAMWDEDKWPQAFGVNGYVNVGGEKMSKSKGNFIPMRDLVKKHGADLTRINIAASNENMDDADWREDSLHTYNSRINYLFELVSQLKKAKGKTPRNIEKYLESRLQELISASTESYEQMKFRSASQYALFGLINEIKSYIDRMGGIANCNKKILDEAVEAVIKLVAPLTPHVAEELWSKTGKKSLVSTEKWPEPQPEKIDKKIMQLEETYKKTLEDVKQVAKIAKAEDHLCLYFATDEELAYFKDSTEHLEKLGFKKISLFKSTDPKAHDPQDKGKRAKFGRPGIFLE
jgi:leucyl-tRNA synthetase